MEKIIVGLSGGVDSSVAAYLLKQEGYRVEGMFMQNWHDTTGLLAGDCPWEDDLLVARLVAHKLDIPLHFTDLSGPYYERVVNYMFREYQAGRTPNPDVLCNREIKFDLFIREAEKQGAGTVATGHYCRKETIGKNGKTIHRLLAGTDPNKDQSYFLCQLSQEQLSKVIFPLGHMKKPEVRKLAGSMKLATAFKKDSQGICFVGKVDLPTFLQQKLKAREGTVIEIPAGLPQYRERTTGQCRQWAEKGDFHFITRPWTYDPGMGTPVGSHRGAHFFTIGQRKGLNIGGKEQALFVIGTDVEHNLLYVGQGQDHPGLYRRGLFIPAGDEHWVRPDLALSPGEQAPYLVRIRYRQPLQQATLHKTAEGIHILFDQPQRGITPGQFAAWYREDELVGSGVIQ
ncbi:MAG TPA: tRNA 2-thiouridine(34) synthase MnmA [Bacteroidetes bacterium]|nr:tRNA 2-thiouridine(34) synthase MnmA [Bacteroidota bacterium]